jgi:hypothetical protein
MGRSQRGLTLMHVRYNACILVVHCFLLAEYCSHEVVNGRQISNSDLESVGWKVR